VSHLVTEIRKPMLAGEVEDVATLRYPLLCTPKIDGIRVMTIADTELQRWVGLSRSGIPLPNIHLQELVNDLRCSGLDGEMVASGAATFGEVDSAIMSREKRATLEFHVFDYTKHPLMPYWMRVQDYRTILHGAPSWVRPLLPEVAESPEQLLQLEARMLAEGHEGVMVRDPQGPYKHGRSTLREGWLLKLIRHRDEEAEVIGMKELMHNENAQERDAHGHSKRSTAQAGLVGAGTLGALLCRTAAGVEFSLGTGEGLTAELRARLFEMHQRGELVGRFAKYRHRPKGAKTKPRFPVFLGLRDERDMS
jgi:DNA ligase-1